MLIDVRTPEEFAGGHLAGARNIDVEGAGFVTTISALDKTKNYAVYCRAGNRSKIAMAAMQQAGLSSVFDLDGGINGWKSAGGEVVN